MGYFEGKRALPCLSKYAKNATNLLSLKENKCPETVASMLCQNNYGQFENVPIRTNKHPNLWLCRLLSKHECG